MKADTVRGTRGRAIWALSVCTALLLHVGTGHAMAYSLLWVQGGGSGGGSWPIASYWHDSSVPIDQVPTLADDATIANGGDAAIRNLDCTAKNLYLDSATSSPGRIAWRSDNTRNLTIAEDLFVGYSGTGRVRMVQSDNPTTQPAKKLLVGDEMIVGRNSGAVGTVTQDYGTVEVIRDLALGSGSGSQGTYTISGDAELIVKGSTTASQYLYVGLSGSGTLNQNGGTVTVGTYLRIAEGSASHGTYTMTDGTLDVSGGYSIICGRRNDGTFIQSGGEVYGPTGSQGIYLGYEGHGVGEWQLSGDGLVNSGRFLRVGQAAEGIFTQTGGSVVVPTDAVLGYSAGSVGTYTISGGALDVDATLTVGSAGTGTFHIIGDDATIDVDGYTQNALSTLELDINGISAINVDGAVALAGALDIEFIATPEPGQWFPLILNDGTDAVTGIFAGMLEGAMFRVHGSDMAVQLTYVASFDGGSVGNDVALQVTPEPATLTLLALGALGLAARRRRVR